MRRARSRRKYSRWIVMSRTAALSSHGSIWGQRGVCLVFLVYLFAGCNLQQRESSLSVGAGDSEPLPCVARAGHSCREFPLPPPACSHTPAATRPGWSPPLASGTCGHIHSLQLDTIIKQCTLYSRAPGTSSRAGITGHKADTHDITATTGQTLLYTCNTPSVWST
jgi:hypothetical protein